MDYFKSLITSYQEMNNIPTNTVRIVKLNDSQFVHISHLFARDNYFQGFDLLQAINNYISQVNGPIYHMQVVYRDDGHGQYLEKIYLEFSLADYEQLNVALKQVLEPTQYWLLTKKQVHTLSVNLFLTIKAYFSFAFFFAFFAARSDWRSSTRFLYFASRAIAALIWRL